MNEITPPDGASDVPWPTRDHRARVPDTCMLPGSEKAPPPAIGVLKNAVQGAHDTIDRLASSAAPAVHQLGDTVSAAAEALNVKTGQLRDTRDEWAESLRSTVRCNPLAAMAGAVVLGVVIARLTR